MLVYEPDSGILRCATDGEVASEAGRDFVDAMHAAITEARSHDPVLRILLDARGGFAFPGETRNALIAELRPLLQPGDRTAVLVANSLSKIHIRDRGSRHGAFISESAARTWLSA